MIDANRKCKLRTAVIMLLLARVDDVAGGWLLSVLNTQWIIIVIFITSSICFDTCSTDVDATQISTQMYQDKTLHRSLYLVLFCSVFWRRSQTSQRWSTRYPRVAIH